MQLMKQGNCSQNFESIVGTGTPYTLSNALARLAAANGDLSALDVEEVAQAMNATDVMALKKAFGDPIFDDIETALQSADVDEVRKVIYNDLIGADLTRLGTAQGSVTDNLAARTKELANGMLQPNKRLVILL